MMAAMEFAALFIFIQGKLPPLLAADDSSQILDRASVRKGPTMGGVSHLVRGIQAFTQGQTVPDRVAAGIRLAHTSASSSENPRGTQP